MKPIDPADVRGRFVNFAEHQDQYEPLPARVHGNVVHTRWRLTLWERLQVLLGRCIDIRLMTFGKPLQPILPVVQRDGATWHCYEEEDE